jgi:hypothetical protein
VDLTANPASGSLTYESGSTVKITASPEPGWSLDEWILDDSPTGNDNPISVKMNKDHVLSTVFRRDSYSLSLNVAGSGFTDPSSTQTYTAGSEARVTATPDPGWVFDHWILDRAPAYSGNPVTVSMSSDHALEAVFVEEQYLLKVLAAGEGKGSVVSDPLGGTYSFGSVVVLTADPAEVSSFSGWSGDVSGSANPAIIVMNGNKTMTVNFDPVTVGQDSVAKSPSQSSYARSLVQLTATPASGGVFSGWGGAFTGSPITVTSIMVNLEIELLGLLKEIIYYLLQREALSKLLGGGYWFGFFECFLLVVLVICLWYARPLIMKYLKWKQRKKRKKRRKKAKIRKKIKKRRRNACAIGNNS